MKSDTSFRFLTLWLLGVLMVTVASQEFNIEDNVKELLSRRKNLEFMRQLVEDMDNQLTRLQKRTCYYNAGMSHNCDYKEMNKNMNDETIWNDGPGKRKRSSEGAATKDGVMTLLSKRSCLLRLPGMDCDYGDIAGDIKNQGMWGHEDSPGKKRRSNICYKIGNPEGCLGKVIDDNKKDTSHWGDPDGPGKK